MQSGRQRIQSGWLAVSGAAIAALVIYSMTRRAAGDSVAASLWLGWAIVTMLASMWVSIVIEFAFPRREREYMPCCECCQDKLRIPRLPPVPKPGDPPDLNKV